MVGITKLRIKFGPEGSFKAFQTFNAKTTEKKPIGEEEEGVTKLANQSRKRGPEELEEEVQANKKQKLNRVLSSQCLNLLKSLRGHEFGWLFGEPVDPVKLNIPDYFSVISKPMDLGTISSKLLRNVYSSADEFAADVRLTFDNALTYNPPENFVHDVAKELQEIFEARWESLRKKKVSDLHGEKVTEGSRRQPVEVGWVRQSSPETSASSGRFSAELPKRAKEMSQKVPPLLKSVTKLSKKDTPVVTQTTLATKLRIKKFEQGLGSTVENPSKGSTPTSSCRCSSCGRITCICLKSCNSSGSEVSTLTDNLVKDNSCSQASESDPHSNGSISSKNDCVSSQLDTPLDNELKKPLPPMPPLPPEKAIRAAILKCQFAETILKAKHRKVLDKSNKSDLIRIQIEKEQMEKTQREEKARIEAEIAAAKLATRMRAEAELKEKRERERLKLEKMVKEVDLEENNASKFNENMINLCGSCDPTRTWLPELGLFLRNDDDDSDEDDSEVFDAMRIDDLEEGEIL